MPRLVGLMLAGALWMGSGNAAVAAPVKGGHYHFVMKLGDGNAGVASPEVSVELTLANDGRELAYPSGVSEQLACGRNAILTDGIGLDGAVDAPFLALAVAADGHFATRGRFLGGTRRFSLTVRFTRGGGAAVGTLAVRGRNAACPNVHLAFRAPLVSRPNAPPAGRPSVCDRVTIRQIERLGNDESYRVYDHGIGCTAARQIARQWHASPRCRQLMTNGVCHLRGATCRAVTGGLFNGLVSAQCSAAAFPRGVAEFVHFEPCTPPMANNDADITMWAVNRDCAAAAAFPIDTLVGDPESDSGPCGAIYDLPFKAVTCTPVGGYACRARNADFGGEPGFYAVCVQAQDGFRALVFYDEV